MGLLSTTCNEPMNIPKVAAGDRRALVLLPTKALALSTKWIIFTCVVARKKAKAIARAQCCYEQIARSARVRFKHDGTPNAQSVFSLCS